MKVLAPLDLVDLVQQNLKAHAYDVQGVAQLNWHAIDFHAPVIEINNFLRALNDPFTGLVDEKQIEEELQMAKMPALFSSIIDDILYIRLSHFLSMGIAQKLQECLQTAGADRRKIIDLRNNLGGSPEAAQSCASVLLPPRSTIEFEHRREDGGFVLVRYFGTSASTVGTGVTKGKDSPPRSKRKSLLRNVVVLVNGRTASAAELLAGALRDNGAPIVGQNTWGKSIGQRRFYLEAQGDVVLSITTEHGFTPTGLWLGNGANVRHGMQPDHIVEYRPRSTKFAPNSDPQLLLARQLLR